MALPVNPESSGLLTHRQIECAADWLKTWAERNSSDPAVLVSFALVPLPDGTATAMAVFAASSDDRESISSLAYHYDPEGTLLNP